VNPAVRATSTIDHPKPEGSSHMVTLSTLGSRSSGLTPGRGSSRVRLARPGEARPCLPWQPSSRRCDSGRQISKVEPRPDLVDTSARKAILEETKMGKWGLRKNSCTSNRDQRRRSGWRRRSDAGDGGPAEPRGPRVRGATGFDVADTSA